MTRLRLEYRPERRFVGGVEKTVAQALDHGLMASPFVSWDGSSQRLRLARDCYPPVVYDFSQGTITTEAVPAACTLADGGTSEDAGVADSGTGADGGADDSGPETDDAATLEDGPGQDGQEGTGLEGGCGCVTSVGAAKEPELAALLLVGLALWVALRRLRRSMTA
jgi:hypothetical protein